MQDGVTRRASLAAIAAAGLVPHAAKAEVRRDDFSAGVFADAHLLEIPAEIDLVSLAGTRRVGDEGAGQLFVADPAVDTAHVAANPATAFIDARGRGFRRALDAGRLKDELATTQDGLGANLVGHRRSPRASITSAHGKLRHIVLMGEDYGRNGSFTAADIALAAAEAQQIVIPENASATTIAATVELAPYTTIIGRGPDRSVFNITAPLGFRYQSPRGTDQYQSPSFEHVRMICAGSAIRLNSATGGFTDDDRTQMSLMGPRLFDVDLRGPGPSARGSIGVEWNKCFRGIIDQSNIQSFETGLLSLGSDFGEVRGRTRLWGCGTLADIRKIGQAGYNYGSGFRFDGCDLLSPSVTFIKSDDNDLKIVDCYFETGTPLRGYVLDLSGTNAQSIVRNRFEVPGTVCPRFLRQQGELSLFVFEHNNTDGEPWGDIDWNGGAGARVWKSVLQRQRLMFRGNRNDMAPVPFRTIDPEKPRGYLQPWIFTPGTVGLRPLNFGLTLRARDGYFVIPPMSGSGSLCIFEDPDEPISGTVNVHVLARGSASSQRLTAVRLDGGRYAASATANLSASEAWHTIFSAVAVDRLQLQLYNDDTGSRGEALVRKVVVERVG